MHSTILPNIAGRNISFNIFNERTTNVMYSNKVAPINEGKICKNSIFSTKTDNFQ